MKKLLIAACALAAMFLTSCGGKQDANGWYSDFDAAKKAAQSKNKSILLFVNSDLNVEGSEAGVSAILSKEFASAVKNDFVLCYFNFTDMQSKLGNVNMELSSSEQKNLEKLRNEMKKQFKIADMYTVQTTPSVTLLTKDGYYASALNCDYSSASADGYASLVNEDKKYIEAVNEMVDKVKKASGKELALAVTALHDSMYETHRLAMADFVRKAVQADRKDESGCINKLIMSLVSFEVYEELTNENIESAVRIYAKYAEDKRLDKENVQMLYYTAAQVLANSRTAKLDDVKSYLEKAVSVDPESEYGVQIQSILNDINSADTTPAQK